MSLDADTIVDRRRMRRKLTFWRVFAVVVAIGAVVALGAALRPAGIDALTGAGGASIARITITGIIRSDPERVTALERRQSAGFGVQVRVAHNVAQAVREAAFENGSTLIVLEWPGVTRRKTDAHLEDLIADPPAQLILVRAGPLAPDRTRLVSRIYGRSTDAADQAAQLATLAATNAEDTAMVARLMPNLESPFYRVGPASRWEWCRV